MTVRWPRLSTRPAVALFALASTVGLAQGLLMRQMVLSRGVTPHDPIVLFQLTGAIGAWASMPVAQFAALNAPSPTPADPASSDDSTYRAVVRWTRFLLAHVLGYCAFSAVHIALIRGLRRLLLALSVVAVGDGALGARILWEMQNDMVVYACAAAILTMMRAFRERDETRVRTSALEARLAEARLDALAAQVDPHFFYNALNTISATMYEDLARTERYLTNLAAIMRATLGSEGRTWTLDEERAHTERYLELMTARFGDRLRATFTQGETIGAVHVPRFSVQSLVENAVKHNARRVEPLSIHVDARLDGDGVVVSVTDDGVGFSPGPVPVGRGLGRLEETLRLLHGSEATLERGTRAGGGAEVRWSVPYVVP